jgi:WD repeat-containing protein 70
MSSEDLEEMRQLRQKRRHPSTSTDTSSNHTVNDTHNAPSPVQTQIRKKRKQEADNSNTDTDNTVSESNVSKPSISGNGHAPIVTSAAQLRLLFPTSFGQSVGTGISNPITNSKNSSKQVVQYGQQQQQQDHHEDEDEEEDFVGPAIPAALKKTVKADDYDEGSSSGFESGSEDEFSDDATDSQSSSEDLIQSLVPRSHQITLRGHTKGISALALDRSGSRLLTGSLDYTVKFWNFAGMDQRLQSFREVEPNDGHPVYHVEYNHNGQYFFVATGSSQARIYSRDGIKECEFVRGDMYIVDRKNTKGHVSGVLSGHWNPKQVTHLISSSMDGTIRLWDTAVPERNLRVFKIAQIATRSVPVTACAYSPNGQSIYAAGSNGCINMYDPRSSRSHSARSVPSAHQNGTDTSSLVMSLDNRTLISRGGDHTVKVWDVRKFKDALKVFDHVPNMSSHTDVLLSPTEQLIVTGTSSRSLSDSKTSRGQLAFFDRRLLKHLGNIDVCGGSVTRVLWNKTINQLVVGGSDSETHMLYSPLQSKNGALLCAGRRAKQKDASDFIKPISIVNPIDLHARNRSRKNDGKSSTVPTRPMIGKGHGGRLGSSQKQHVLKATGSVRMITKEDPREALLKYADEAAANPVFSQVYQSTQPVPVFTVPDEHDDTPHPDDARALRLREIQSRLSNQRPK